MKPFRIVFIFFVVLSVSSSLKAQTVPLAVGVRVSSNAPVINSSISARYYLSDDRAVEGLLSFKPVALGALYEVFKPLNVQGLNWFYGGGAYVGFSKPVSAGAQGIVGLDYNFAAFPLNLSLDWKPELSIAPKVNFEPAAVAISLRFTLNKNVFAAKNSDKSL